jgi:5-methylcytosine-specific restriction enzyme A
MSRCHELGLVTDATQTDHVIPHRGDARLFWDEENNWQALCAPCGARKSQAGL